MNTSIIKSLNTPGSHPQNLPQLISSEVLARRTKNNPILVPWSSLDDGCPWCWVHTCGGWQRSIVDNWAFIHIYTCLIDFCFISPLKATKKTSCFFFKPAPPKLPESSQIIQSSVPRCHPVPWVPCQGWRSWCGQDSHRGGPGPTGGNQGCPGSPEGRVGPKTASKPSFFPMLHLQNMLKAPISLPTKKICPTHFALSLLVAE